MSRRACPVDVPLSDLHRHLDGSLRPATLEALAAEVGVDLPEDIRFFAGMGLDAALSRFAVTLSLLQEPTAVRRVAREMVEDATAEGVTTLEIRFAPQLHEGAPMAAIVDAALEGVDGRAGLILCALYGDAPELVSALVDLAADRPGVVAIDLAGGPQSGHSWSMGDYRGAFSRARDLGIGRTVHAGEGRPASEIRVAVEELHAQRIGHGCTVLDDDGVVELLLERGTTIEACPTSNVHTGVFAKVEDHPIVQWLNRGLRVCVNTDNTLLSDLDAPSELARVAAIEGMTTAALEQVVAFGHEARFRR